VGDAFSGQVKRLVARLRWQRAYLSSCTGLFWGLFPGLLVVALDGTMHFPFSVLDFAILAAAVGALAGAGVGILRKVDDRALLIKADQLLAGHELASTARELVAHGSQAPFTAAIVADATRLLSRQPAREALDKRRPRLLPFLPLIVALLVLALLYPVDLRAIFTARQGRERELVMLGQDLQSYGEKLLDAKSPDQGRSLALSQQLTQLGKDLADRTLQGDEALDRIAEMEGMLSREYDMRMQEVQPSNGIPSQTGTSPPGSQSGGRQSNGSAQSQTNPGGDTGQGSKGSAGNASSDALKNLSDARDRLRQTQRNLAEKAPTNGTGPTGKVPASPGAAPPATGDLPGASPDADGAGSDAAAGSADSNAQPDAPGSLSTGEAPGTNPSSSRNGAPTSIATGQSQAPTKENLPSGEGDSTRLLVRALPDPTGARLSDQTVLNGYQRQAESALAHDEIPLGLRPYVKDYFTVIGMGQTVTGQ